MAESFPHPILKTQNKAGPVVTEHTELQTKMHRAAEKKNAELVPFPDIVLNMSTTLCI